MSNPEPHPKKRIRVDLTQTHPAPTVSESLSQTPDLTEPSFVGDTYCKNHPHELARFLCGKCRRYYCDLCVSIRPLRGVPTHWCRHCGSVCDPVVAAPTPAQTRSFAQLALRAFGYPFAGHGAFLTLTGTLFILFLDLLSWVVSFAAILGLLAVVILSVLGGGYLFAFLKSVVQCSAQGKDVLPDWPDITDFVQDMVMPFFQCLVILAFCFLPGLILQGYGQVQENPAMTFGGGALMVWGLCYFPMALLTVSMFDSIAGINPMLVIPSIARTVGHYFIVIVVFLVLLGLGAGVDFLFTRVAPIPLAPSILGAFFNFYAIVVLARSIGLLYRVNEDELGWFKPQARP